jgi:glutamyl-tRNA reductase
MTLKELEHLRKTLPQLSEAEFDLIRAMAKRMAQKFLQEPTVELKALLSAGEEEDSLLRFFRSIFRI